MAPCGCLFKITLLGCRLSNLIASAYCVRSAGGSPWIFTLQSIILLPGSTRQCPRQQKRISSINRKMIQEWCSPGSCHRPPSTSFSLATIDIHAHRHYQPPNNHHRSPSHLSSRKGISARKGTANGWLSNNLPPRCIAAGCSPVWVWWSTTQQ